MTVTAEVPPVTEAPPTEQDWVYLGQRLNTKGKLTHAWRDAEGKVVLFDKMKGGTIGGHYTVYLTDNDMVYTAGRYAPVFQYRSGDVSSVLDWELEHKRATMRVAAERKSKQLDTELDQALAPIRARYRKLLSHTDRATLLAVVIQRITG
jgi:hypothetical protein